MIAHTMLKGRPAVQLSLNVLHRKLSLTTSFEGLQIHNDNVMLQLKIVLLALVKSTKHKELSLELVTACPDSSGQSAIGKRNPSEKWCF